MEHLISCHSRPCLERGEEGIVYQCRFHPLKPKLACSLTVGKICIFSSADFSAPFSDWNETVFLTNAFHSVRSIDWNMDGSQLAAGCEDGTLVVLNEDGTKCFEINEHFYPISFIKWNRTRERSHILVTGIWGKTAIVWDSNQQSALQTFQFHEAAIRDLVWTSATAFASCSYDGTIRICTINQSTTLRTLNHEAGIVDLRWNESSQLLASCCLDGSINIWSLDQTEPVSQLKSEFRLLCFDCHQGSEGWRIAGGCHSGPIFVWNFKEESSTEPQVITGLLDRVDSVAFSSNGTFLASIDRSGHFILWSAQNWEAVFVSEMPKCLLMGFHLSWDCSSSRVVIANPSSVEVNVVEW